MTLGDEPKTSRSKRTVPVARSVMRRLENHLANFVGPEPDALMFTALFEDGSEVAMDRLDTLLGGGWKDSDNILQIDAQTEVSPEESLYD